MRKTTVYAYDKHGKYIQEYRSVTAGAEAHDTNPPAIQRCFNQKNYTAGGVYWRRFKRKVISVPPAAVAQYDINGNLVATFYDVDEAVEKTGIKRSYIGSSLNSEKPKKTQDFYFRKYSLTKNPNGPSKTLSLKEKENKYQAFNTKESVNFKTIQEAANHLSVSKQAVQQALKSKGKCKGFYIKRIKTA